MSAKLPPTVLVEPIFVRDSQRRLRLVMDLPEQELRKPFAPPNQLNDQTTKTEVYIHDDRRYLRSGVQRAATAK